MLAFLPGRVTTSSTTTEGCAVIEYVSDRWEQILFASWQHFSLVVQCLVLATVVSRGER